MWKLRRVGLGTLIAIVASVCFVCGIGVGALSTQEERIVEKEVPVEIEVVKVVTQTIEIPIEVERIVEVPIEVERIVTQIVEIVVTPAVQIDSTPIPEPTATPSVEDFFISLIRCERVRFEGSMLWGQAPGTIYSGDPRITGRLESGDYIQFVMPEPNADGEIRIQVYPHDYRTVGQTDNQVWIDYGSLANFRLDLLTFFCEDTR